MSEKIKEALLVAVITFVVYMLLVMSVMGALFFWLEGVNSCGIDWRIFLAVSLIMGAGTATGSGISHSLKKKEEK